MNKIKHVLFLPDWYPNPENGQNGIFIKMQALAVSRYFKTTVVFVRSGEIDGKKYDRKYFKQGNFAEYIVYYRKSNYFLIKLLRLLYAYYIAIFDAARLEGRPGIVHIHVLGRSGLPALLMKFFWRIPYVITEHWSGYASGDFRKKTWVKRRLNYFIAYHSFAFISVSEFLKTALVSNGFKKRITVIPNIVDSENEIILSQAIPGRLIMIADLVDAIKNISGVIEAFKIVLLKDYSMVLNIYGIGHDAEFLKLTAGALLNKNIFFHGEKDHKEIMEAITTSGFLIVNSHYETFSIVTAEAMLCGRPVIATRCGGPEQFITDKTGVLIKKNDPGALAGAILKMNRELNNYDPMLLHNSIKENYSSKHVVGKLGSIYNSIISEGSEN